MFHLRPKVFRDPDAISGVELFDLLDNRQLQDYNIMLLEAGRTLQITKTKTWAKAGTPATEFASAMEDAYYTIVEYLRMPNSPYEPSFGRLEAGGAILKTLVIAARPEPLPEPDDPEDFIVDIRDQQEAKKNPKRKPKRKPKPS